ncbi:MAG TPA: response regulator transcription factor [Caulobacteraceae bacterium]|jgi:DNA-binding NarL/FixJ family response regulator
MEPSTWRGASEAAEGRDTVLISAVRFLRESLSEILSQVAEVRVTGEAASLSRALELARVADPEIVLLDAAFPDGQDCARQISAAAPRASIIALGIFETEDDVLSWAEAGVVGYVPNTASVDDLVALIGQISRGEQACPSNIAGSLLRRLASSGRAPERAAPLASLTRREHEILSLVRQGLSNKDIARRLRISLGTTKSHVHNLLSKLNVQRRAEVITQLAPQAAGSVRPQPPEPRWPNQVDPPRSFPRP